MMMLPLSDAFAAYYADVAYAIDAGCHIFITLPCHARRRHYCFDAAITPMLIRRHYAALRYATADADAAIMPATLR